MDIDFLEDITMYKIIIDFDKCISCGDCVEVCPEDTYALEEEKLVVVNEEDCVNCETCADICEFEAIAVEEE